jgi:poly(3-hydroxybutyrate) depolymerase
MTFSWSQTDSNSKLGTYERQYRIRLPQGYTGKEKTNLLIFFHGWGGTMKTHDWKEQANNYNTITVNPQGMEDSDGYVWGGAGSWNVDAGGRTDVCRNPSDAYQYKSCETIGKTGACNCYTCYDDVKFVEDLMAYLQSALCIDTDQIHASGDSAGSMFMYHMVPKLAEAGSKLRFKSIAPFYGANLQNMDDVPASVAGTSVISFHGKLDTEIPVAGGLSADGYLYVAEATTLSEYAKANGCASTETVISTPYDSKNSQTCHEHKGCKGGARIVRCIYANEYHDFWYTYSMEETFFFLNTLKTGNSTVLI